MATIKRGSYRWNDSPAFPPFELTTAGVKIPIPISCDTITIEEGDDTFVVGTFETLVIGGTTDILIIAYYDNDLDLPFGIYSSIEGVGWNGLSDEFNGIFPQGYGQIFTVTEDTDVDDTFATWFTANTEPVVDDPTTPIKKFTRLYLGDVAYSSGGKCFKRLSTIMKLSPPTISLNGDTLTITDTSGKATQWNVYKDGGIWMGGIAEPTIDLSGRITESGTYSITVTAFADGYEESEPSNAVEYVVSDEITDLTGTTWNVPSGWLCSADFGRFYINGSYSCGSSKGDITGFYLGKTSTSTKDNWVHIYTGQYGANWSNTYALTFTFTGGTDVTNPKLIEWLETYGELQ